MAEYIERDKIFPDGVFFVDKSNPLEGIGKLINRIANMPAADVVEVVRCKDCRKGRPVNKLKSPERYFKAECIVCECEDVVDDAPMVYQPMHFCSYGERKPID